MQARFDDKRGSLVLTGLIRTIEAWSLSDVVPAIRDAEAAASGGSWCAGFVAYEAGSAFDPALETHEPIPELPLVWFGVFEEATSAASPSRGGDYLLNRWYPNISERTHSESIDRIKKYIAAGDTYQVNHTFRLRSEFSGDPEALYADLVAAQKGDYSAFLDIGTHWVASASPELFFRWQGDEIEVKPMKGTVRRGRWSAEDRDLATHLSESEKDRAENLMITDLLRNDLGKLAVVGSVTTDPLFELERYETVWQLTSTIKARLPEETDLADVFGALFPSGSITGAPKARTTEIIRELEIDPRGVYCGAIGLLQPADGSVRADFNVAIRTVAIEKATSIAEFGVGGGITWYSTNEGEYQEALWKTAILDERRPELKLLETLRWDDDFLFLSDHMQRLGSSAEYFGFDFDPTEAERALKALELGPPQRVRLTLDSRGTCGAEASSTLKDPFADSIDSAADVEIALASTPVQPHDPLLYHKTTHREVYEQAGREVPDGTEAVLFNAYGELTESTIANLALRIDGIWYTPPLNSGCLPGIYRRQLIEDGTLVERILPVSALDSAEEIGLINSVRGWRRGVLD